MRNSRRNFLERSVAAAAALPFWSRVAAAPPLAQSQTTAPAASKFVDVNGVRTHKDSYTDEYIRADGVLTTRRPHTNWGSICWIPSARTSNEPSFTFSTRPDTPFTPSTL
jgi:hypothetical protein